jgi:hypothetical protein
MPLKDVVVYLGNRGATGTLSFEREGLKKQVLVDHGQVVNASSNTPAEYLGQFLINLGHITEEQFDRAYKTQLETRVFLGRILVMIGLVSEQTVKHVLNVKFRETVLEAFGWTTGSFSFDAGDRPPQPDGLEVRVPLIEIHKESEFRAQAWARFQKVFPSGAHTLRLVPENLDEQPKPGSLEARLFEALATQQTIDELALTLHATDFFLYQRLYALHTLGALEVIAPGATGVEFDIDVDLGLGDSPSAEQLMENARTFYAKGNYRDAFALARRSHQVTPSIDATLLLKQIEVAWLPQLRSDLLLTRRVPVLQMLVQEVRRLPLSAPERYLLSRADGQRDVETIVRVAPLKEFEALAFFDRFVAQGWVRFAPVTDRG